MSARLTEPCLRDFIRQIKSRSRKLPSRMHESIFFASPDGWNVSHQVDLMYYRFTSHIRLSPNFHLWTLYVRKKLHQLLFTHYIIYTLEGDCAQTFAEAPGFFHVSSSREQPHPVWYKSSRTEEKNNLKFEVIWISIWRFNISGEALCCASLK